MTKPNNPSTLTNITTIRINFSRASQLHKGPKNDYRNRKISELLSVLAYLLYLDLKAWLSVSYRPPSDTINRIDSTLHTITIHLKKTMIRFSEQELARINKQETKKTLDKNHRIQ